MENPYDIDVQVETTYVAEHSEPDEDRFVFAYTITLVNRGSVTAQLISRHWFITDADNRTEEVEGEALAADLGVEPNPRAAHASIGYQVGRPPYLIIDDVMIGYLPDRVRAVLIPNADSQYDIRAVQEARIVGRDESRVG